MGADLYDPQRAEALEVHLPPPPSTLGLQGMRGGKSGSHGTGKEDNFWPFIRELARRKGKHDADPSMSDRLLAEFATQFGVHPTQITEWKQHVRARAVDVFGGTKSTSDAPDRRATSSLSVCWNPDVARLVAESKAAGLGASGCTP